MKSNLEFQSHSHAEKTLEKIDLGNVFLKGEKGKKTPFKHSVTIKQVHISFCKHTEK